MPNPLAAADINIRSARYLIARTAGMCPQCDASTSLFALALPPGHEVLEPDDAPADEAAEDTWSIATHHAFLFYIEYLPDPVQRRFNGLTQCYRVPRSEVVEAYWANHCTQCGFLLDDQELFCEPDGAFLPTSEGRASAVHLLAVDEAIEVAAAGYAHEPMFFHAMRRG